MQADRRAGGFRAALWQNQGREEPAINNNNRELAVQPGGFFSPWRSLVYFIAACLLAWQTWSPYLDQPGEASLSYPVETLHYMSETDLLFFDRVAASDPASRAVYEFLWGTRDDSLAYYIEAYASLRRWQVSTQASETDLELNDLRRFILAGEAGESELLATIELPSDIRRVAHYAYGLSDSLPEHGDLEAVLGKLEDGWFLQSLWSRLAARKGDLAAREQEQAQLQARGEAVMSRTNQYLAWINLPIMATLLVLFGFILRWRPGRSLLPSPLAGQGRADWHLVEGVAIWVRAEFWVMLYFLLVLQYLWWLPLLYQWGALFSALPALWLIRRYLLQPRGLSFTTAFGLSPRQFGWWRLFVWVCVVVAFDVIGSYLIQSLSGAAQLQSSWAEGVSETLLWGEPYAQFMEVIETIVWAPLLEEILFRGVIFVALLSVMRVVPAALLSGLLFAVLHFYSLAGTLELLWSSLVWSVAYVRCRSLLPAICAHSILNIQWVGLWLVLY